MTNILNGEFEKKNIDKEATFKDFSAKFISTIAASGSDSSGNLGGTRDGWLLIEAIKQFDNDWSKTYFYYMEALELEDPKKLVEKLYGKVHMFRDNQNKLRVAVVKNKTNSDVMDLIDSAISRRFKKIFYLKKIFRHRKRYSFPVHRFAFSDSTNRTISSTYQHPIRLSTWNSTQYFSNILYQTPQPENIDFGLSQNIAHSTTTIDSNNHKTPPLLNETCSETKKLRFLPQYFEKIYADKEWFSKKKKNSLKSSSSFSSSASSSDECIISSLCSEFSLLKIFD